MLSPHVAASRARLLSTTALRAFLGNIFSSKEAKTKKILETQDEYEVDPQLKITFLTKENSSSFKPFDVEKDLPGFKITQWKEKVVRPSELESSVTDEVLTTAINQAFLEVTGSTTSKETYAEAKLDDLQARFRLSKALQQKLGFDIKDHIITRSHTLDYLYESLTKEVSHRWSSERNPNAIVLRPEDFEAEKNVYLNKQLSKLEQEKFFEDMKTKALGAQ